MTKRFLIIVGGIVIPLLGSAAVLTPEQALRRAHGNAVLKVSGCASSVKTPVYTAMTQQNEAAVYVFASQEDKGYVMLSADDRALPILGYSDDGLFDANNIPPQLEWWLGEYTKEIEYVRNNSVKPSSVIEYPSNWGKIEPMVKTKWNQDAPYNDACPEFRSQRCYTGCVATSMAQVMNYFEYPEKGQGIARYVCGGIGRLELNFANKKFDWGNMLDVYSDGLYTEEQADAVAYLMQACGYSVEMAYGTDASGAVSAQIPKAFTDYFKYDGNIRYVQRMVYSSMEWAEMIYNNLKNVGPVINGGHSPNGGHSFVCDGYDGNGYFHFNWGWGGSADGYYLLNALNPSTQGIGGSEGGFNSGQDAILGIQKPTGDPVVPQELALVQYGALQGEVSGLDISMKFTDWNPVGLGNGSTEKIRCYLGGIIEPVDGTSGETTYKKVSNYDVLSFSVGSYLADSKPVLSFPADLGDGKYKVTLASKDSKNDNAEWIPTTPPYGYANYFYVEKSGGSIAVKNVDVPRVTIESLTFDSELYYGYLAKLKIKIHNPSDYELTQAVCPVLMDNEGVRAYTGSSKLFTVPAGETYEEVWDVGFSRESGTSAPSAGKSIEYTLAAYNPDVNISYGEFGTIEMKKLRSKNNFRSRGLSIINEEQTDDELLGIVYSVSDPEMMEIEQKVEVVSGYFAYPMFVRIYREDENNPGYLSFEMEQSFNDVVFISSGEVGTINATVEYPDAIKDKVYYMRTYYVDKNAAVELGQVKFRCSSLGVEQVRSDDDVKFLFDNSSRHIEVLAENGIKSVRGFYADGRTIVSRVALNDNEATIDLGDAPHGIVVFVVVDKEGTAHSFKVAI